MSSGKKCHGEKEKWAGGERQGWQCYYVLSGSQGETDLS